MPHRDGHCYLQSIAMISCHYRHLEILCSRRGYTMDEVRPCIIGRDGDTITVDESHPAYPRKARPGFVPPKFVMQGRPSALPVVRIKPPAKITSGPGTELKKLLAKIGITATPNCACNARARRMDEEEARHPGWCEEHLEEIVGWLREEARKRSLPFVDAAGRMLVRRAIKNAKRAAS